MTRDLRAFCQRYDDTHVTIDDFGFDIINLIIGLPLLSIAHDSDPSADEVANFLDGDLELTFATDTTLTVTIGHAGIRVFPYPIATQPIVPGTRNCKAALNQFGNIVGQHCGAVDIVLERAMLYGKTHLTSALIFRFAEIEIGYENFECRNGESRSTIVANPKWDSHKRIPWFE